jgi:4-amino-4-deoxy-L-arabinose transferase-like glycosyltransferase
MLSHNKTTHIILLVTVCLLVFFVHLDVLYVNIMEARNFLSARDMLRENNWLLTTMNALPRYEKPPLPTWLTAISGAIFGLKNVAALRLPSALASLLLVLVSYNFILKLTKLRTQAFITSLILATSFYIVFSGRQGTWDIYTHSFMMVAIYALYSYLLSEKFNLKYALLAGIFIGFSALSKGPVSMYGLLLPFLISYGVVYKFKLKKNLAIGLVVVLVLAIGISMSWYIYIIINDAETLLEIANKETNAWSHKNIRPFYYYWSFFTQSGLWTIPAFISLLYPYLKYRVSNLKAYQFTLLWTVFSVVLLSVIPEKKSRYLLPVLIPLAFNCSFYIQYLFKNFKTSKSRYEVLPVYINYTIIGCVGLLFPVLGIVIIDDLSGYWFWFLLASLSLVGVSIFLLRALYKREIKTVFYLSIVFILCITTFGLPLATALSVNTNMRLPETVQPGIEQRQLPVYVFNNEMVEILWSYGENIPVVYHEGMINLPTETKFIIISPFECNEELYAFFENYNLEQIDYIDLNTMQSNQRHYNKRFIANVFKATLSN